MKQILALLCEKYNSKSFIPILESDIVAFMYHLLVSHLGKASSIHLDTRICQKWDKKFDFVVGAISYRAKRPCIEKPKLVAEVKAFPYGFTHQQHRVHYKHAVDDDLPKLHSLKKPTNLRYMILFDEDDYLRGFDTKAQSSKLQRLMECRDELDSKIVLVHLKNTEKGLKQIIF